MSVLLDTTVTQSTSSLILIAVIAGVTAVLAASVPILMTARAARNMKREDWARQDEVAKRAEEAVTAAEKVAAKAEEVSNAAAAAYALLDQKLTKIAHQTDGAYTAALESELRALQGQAATLREVVALRSAADPSTDSTRTLKVIESAESRIQELESGLDRRKDYQERLASGTLQDSAPTEVTIVNPDPVEVKIAPNE